MIFNEEERSPEEALEYAERVRQLASNQTFQQLINGAEEDCAREWAVGKTAEAREAAWIHLQGIRSLEKQIQKVVDRGAQAAVVLRGRKPA